MVCSIGKRQYPHCTCQKYSVASILHPPDSSSTFLLHDRRGSGSTDRVFRAAQWIGMQTADQTWISFCSASQTFYYSFACGSLMIQELSRSVIKRGLSNRCKAFADSVRLYAPEHRRGCRSNGRGQRSCLRAGSCKTPWPDRVFLVTMRSLRIGRLTRHENH